MDFMNHTYHAAATLLPVAMPKSATLQAIDVSPPVVKLDPWTMFDRLWTLALGYPTKDFKFIQAQTPMSTFRETAIAITLYYIIIFGGREFMRNRPALKLNKLFIIHNFYLTVISGGLLALFIQQLVPGLWKNGLYDGICGKTGWSQNLLVLYYLNYLTKYLELLDTVFLVLKKKPLTFLHTYHHGATALLCYTQLVGNTSVSWVPITLNLGVHVVMYWYYYQSARGVKIWWKQWITTFQITQFVLDLGFIYWACYNYYTSTYAPSLPHYGTCGEKKQEVAAATGCIILSSYLVLFIMFYFSTYKKPVAKKALRRAAKGEVPTLKETSELASDVLRSTEKALADSLPEEATTGKSTI